jgi:hypothetical protein
MTQPEATDCCSQCGHPFRPHVMFALGEHVSDGGIVVCNVPECSCAATWALDAVPRPMMPDAETVARLQAFAQANYGREWSSA